MDEKNNSSDAGASPFEHGQALPAALLAARRIVDAATFPKQRPTIEELEKILAQPDAPPVHINPDGSIGVGENDALIAARGLLAAAVELENWRDWGVIEVAIRNPAVSEYMNHWEGRAEKAEASRDALLAALRSIASVVHGLPRSATADQIHLLALSAITAAEGGSHSPNSPAVLASKGA